MKNTVLFFACGSGTWLGTTEFVLTAGLRSCYRTSGYNATSLRAEQRTPLGIVQCSHHQASKAAFSLVPLGNEPSKIATEAFSAYCEIRVIFGLWMQQSLKCIPFRTCETLHTFSDRDTRGKVKGVTAVNTHV